MENTVDILKALSDRNRLRVVSALSRYDELCACQITELLQVTGATVSRHLSVLQHAGLLSSRKEGRWIYFRRVSSGRTDALLEWVNLALTDSDQLANDVERLEQIVGVEREDLCRQQRGEGCCPNQD